MADRAHLSRQERQRQREVLSGRFLGTESRDGLTIRTSPSVESVMTGSAVGRGRDAVQEPASSRLQVPEPILYNRQHVLESADKSLDSNDGEYEGNDGQSEESEESVENELGQHGDDMDHPSAWGVQRPIAREFLNSQRSILTITHGNTQNSSRRISYPGRRTSAQVRVSQNGCTSAIRSHSPTYLNPLAMPVITPIDPDPTVWELDSGGQQTSSRRNMATGLEPTILARSRDLTWDWTICVNRFPDQITLTEEVRTCSSDAGTKLGFANFANATRPSNDQVSYP